MRLVIIVSVAPTWRCWGRSPSVKKPDCWTVHSMMYTFLSKFAWERGLKFTARKEKRNQVIRYLQSRWYILCLIAQAAVRRWMQRCQPPLSAGSLLVTVLGFSNSPAELSTLRVTMVNPWTLPNAFFSRMLLWTLKLNKSSSSSNSVFHKSYYFYFLLTFKMRRLARCYVLSVESYEKGSRCFRFFPSFDPASPF